MIIIMEEWDRKHKVKIGEMTYRLLYIMYLYIPSTLYILNFWRLLILLFGGTRMDSGKGEKKQRTNQKEMKTEYMGRNLTW